MSEKNKLDDLDAELSAMMHTQVPEDEPDYDGPINLKHKLTEANVIEVKELLRTGMGQKEIAAKFDVNVSTISSIHIGKTWRHLNEPDQEALNDKIDFSKAQSFDGMQHDKIYIDEFGMTEQLKPTDLFGDSLPVKEEYVPPPVIIGADIIKIRTLTGKAEKQAKVALHAATTEMMDQAPKSCFYVPGNVASSKNSKEIGFYLKKSEKTGKYERVNILVDSAATKKYKKETAGYWLKNKVEFLNQTRHLPIPISIEFTFIRKTLGRFDFINASQVLADLMADNGYFPDDDSVHLVPVFNKVVYYHPELAGVIFKVL